MSTLVGTVYNICGSLFFIQIQQEGFFLLEAQLWTVMADKEVTVYIVDVGKRMAGCHNGRSISDLDYALKYVWDKITYAVR